MKTSSPPRRPNAWHSQRRSHLSHIASEPRAVSMMIWAMCPEIVTLKEPEEQELIPHLTPLLLGLHQNFTTVAKEEMLL